MRDIQTFSDDYWTFCIDCDADPDQMPSDDVCGKWMHTFDMDDLHHQHDLIQDAVEQGVCFEAKCSGPVNMLVHGHTGVTCFYIDGSDFAQHRQLISYMLDHDLFPRDEDGRLSDEPFKYDWQTAAGLYDDDFVPELTLSDFVDLNTGKLL